MAADIVVQIDSGGAKRSFPFQGDETLEITPLGGILPILQINLNFSAHWFVAVDYRNLWANSNAT
jgi:hypothetical protein